MCTEVHPILLDANAKKNLLKRKEKTIAEEKYENKDTLETANICCNPTLFQAN